MSSITLLSDDPGADKLSGVGNPRTINTLVFPARSATGLKKTLTLKRKADFGVTVGFKESEYVPYHPRSLILN